MHRHHTGISQAYGKVVIEIALTKSNNGVFLCHPLLLSRSMPFDGLIRTRSADSQEKTKLTLQSSNTLAINQKTRAFGFGGIGNSFAHSEDACVYLYEPIPDKRSLTVESKDPTSTECHSLSRIHSQLEEQDSTQYLINGPDNIGKERVGEKIRSAKSKENETISEHYQRLIDEQYMKEALQEAKKAALVGEVPVGAVMVSQGTIVARAYNRVETEGDPTAHAEMLCIRKAAKQKGGWRLLDSTLYVTLEPCPMCAGALLQARVGVVVWGAQNRLLGAGGSWISLLSRSSCHESGEKRVLSCREGETDRVRSCIHPFNPNIEVRHGVLKSDCSEIMKSFFQKRRMEKAVLKPPLLLRVFKYPTFILIKTAVLSKVFSFLKFLGVC